MKTKIFVNLPVADLNRSMDFFRQLGFTFNMQFTDDTAACMVIDDNIYSMLLTHAKFSEFTPKAIADATTSSEVLVALELDSREEVDAMLDKVVQAGGSEARPPYDFGFMYGRSFNDLDGHIWEMFWMDPNAVDPNAAQK